MLNVNDIKKIHILLRDDIKSTKTKFEIQQLNDTLNYFTKSLSNSPELTSKKETVIKKEYKKTFKILKNKYKKLSR